MPRLRFSLLSPLRSASDLETALVPITTSIFECTLTCYRHASACRQRSKVRARNVSKRVRFSVQHCFVRIPPEAIEVAPGDTKRSVVLGLDRRLIRIIMPKWMIGLQPSALAICRGQDLVDHLRTLLVAAMTTRSPSSWGGFVLYEAYDSADTSLTNLTSIVVPLLSKPLTCHAPSWPELTKRPPITHKEIRMVSEIHICRVSVNSLVPT